MRRSSWKTITVLVGTITEKSLTPSSDLRIFSIKGTSEEQQRPSTSK
jgi:hypothetical protein